MTHDEAHLSIEVSPAAGPIYEQIVEYISQACRRGDLVPGARLPTVRALAEQLGLNRNTIAHAYRVLREAGVIVGQPGRGTQVAAPQLSGHEQLRRQLVAMVGDALAQGVPPALIETLVRQQIQQRQPSLPTPPDLSTAGVVHCLGSHDFCLDLLAHRLHTTYPHMRLVYAPVGSTAGLLALGRGDAQLAGVHLLDPATGEYNRPAAHRLLPETALRFITLVHREQGLIVRRGNPLRLRGVGDLARPGVRFAHRQAGSGTQALLDYLLALQGLSRDQLSAPARELTTHLAVAAAVASGSADVGLGVRAAARALDLDFVPLTMERYDLAFRQDDADAPWLAALLETLASPALRVDIEALEGYDASRTGWLN
jgi:molybdate-binding protein/DNA-binding transcriptional regulator YhcF (GntR family)